MLLECLLEFVCKINKMGLRQLVTIELDHDGLMIDVYGFFCV